MAKLSQDVLGAVPEKQFSLEDIQFVLSDALGGIFLFRLPLGFDDVTPENSNLNPDDTPPTKLGRSAPPPR